MDLFVNLAEKADLLYNITIVNMANIYRYNYHFFNLNALNYLRAKIFLKIMSTL
jgi:hypothetical protein